MLRGGDLKETYDMKVRGFSVWAVTRELGLVRNTVLKYLNSPAAIQPKPSLPRGSKLNPFAGHVDRRMAEGLENCVELLREVRAIGYDGGYTTLVEYVRPRRQWRQPKATLRFETAPGEQAQVDWAACPTSAMMERDVATGPSLTVDSTVFELEISL